MQCMNSPSTGSSMEAVSVLIIQFISKAVTWSDTHDSEITGIMVTLDPPYM